MNSAAAPAKPSAADASSASPAASRVGSIGRLTVLLLALTAVTGLVDAFSFLLLGRVFVANMTGNVVFLAFALAGAPGFSVLSSLIALLAFGIGAFAGGWMAARAGVSRSGLLARAIACEIALDAGALVIAAGFDTGAAATQYVLIALLAPAMGIQNAAARKLAIPDMTTTVLTLTVTGLFGDRPWLGDGLPRTTRRLAAVGSMFAGAVVGAWLVLHSASAGVLALALAVLIAVWVVATRGADRSGS